MMLQRSEDLRFRRGWGAVTLAANLYSRTASRWPCKAICSAYEGGLQPLRYRAPVEGCGSCRACQGAIPLLEMPAEHGSGNRVAARPDHGDFATAFFCTQ